VTAARPSLPGAGLWQRCGRQARGFGRGDAEQAQHAIGELVDGCLVDVLRVALKLAQ
jgi:hypothetical protein